MSSEQKSGIGRVVEKAVDTVGAVAATANAATTTSAETFVEKAAIGDQYEIAASRLALSRSRSPEVRQVARQMIADHTANSHQLMAALEMNEAAGVPAPPRALDSRHQTMIDELNDAPEDSFDSLYLDQQVKAHQETVALMRGYASGGDNPQLRSLALSAVPVVERHLDHVEMLQRSGAARAS